MRALEMLCSRFLNFVVAVSFAFFAWAEDGVYLPGSNARPFSRDGKMSGCAFTNGVLSIDHRGEQDWAVSPFSVIKVQFGSRLRFKAACDWLAPGSAFRLSLAAKFADGRMEWGYRAKKISSQGMYSFELLVPRGCVEIQPRITGYGHFEGRISNLSFCRLEPIKMVSLAPVHVLESPAVRAEVEIDSGSFTVTDKRTGRIWRPSRSGGNGVRSFFAVSVQTLNGAIALRMIDAETMSYSKTVWQLEGNELSVSIEMEDEALPIASVTYPAPMAAADTDALIAPFSEGYRLPIADGFKPVWNTSAWNSSLCMPFFGLEDCRDGSGMMTILETPDDAKMAVFNGEGGRLVGVAPSWEPSLGSFGYRRKVRYVFLSRGGYVAMAKRYRETAKAEGLVKTFCEKVKKVPQLDILIGAPNMWYFAGRGEPSQLEMAKEVRAAGFGRMLWSMSPSSGETAAINRLGDILTSRYDVYRDVYRPDMFSARGMKVPPPNNEICANTSAWPDDVILTRDGDTNSWVKAWGVDDGHGNKIYSAAMCTLMKPKHLRHNLAGELKRAEYNCRFIDVLAAVGCDQCWSSRHRMTRTQSRKAGEEVLGMLGRDYGLVCGSEQGMGAFVPFCDYFEGMLSPWYARMPHGRTGANRQEIFRDPLVPQNVTSNELAMVEKYTTGAKYRIPLFELVFHDCCCAHWYWYDYSNRPLYLWKKRDLLNCLYGTSPMYIFDRRHWDEHREEFLRSYRLVSPIARRTGYSEMISHCALDAERTVQESRFADGTVVTVNFGDRPFRLADGSMLAAEGVRVSGSGKER